VVAAERSTPGLPPDSRHWLPEFASTALDMSRGTLGNLTQPVSILDCYQPRHVWLIAFDPARLLHLGCVHTLDQDFRCTGSEIYCFVRSDAVHVCSPLLCRQHPATHKQRCWGAQLHTPKYAVVELHLCRLQYTQTISSGLLLHPRRQLHRTLGR
jgi:hypothetical protein